MFKKGQVWRNNLSGNLYLVVDVPVEYLCVMSCIAGSHLHISGFVGASAAQMSYKLIGNNYQEK